MSKFSLTDKFETTFEGDVIHVVMSKLKRKDYLKITPFVKIDEVTKEVKMSFNDEQTFLDVAADLLPTYVENFDGLKDDNGKPIEVKTVVEHVYFLKLTSELVSQLMKNSGLQEEDEIKNLEEPQENAITD